MRRPRWSILARWPLLGWLLAVATCHPGSDSGAGPSPDPGSLSLEVLAPALAQVPATSGVARLTGQGVDLSRTLGPGQSVSVQVPPGSYTLVLAGLAEGAVVSLGRREDIVVRAGAETQATVQLQPFVPDPPQAPATTPPGETITVRWDPVPGAAGGYELEWSPGADFGSGVQRGATTRPSLEVSLPVEGVYFFRVRALTDAVSAPGFWSDPSAGTGAVVVDPPVIQLSPDSVVFTGETGRPDPTPEVVAVTNAGGGTLTGLTAVVAGYGSGQPTDWLAVSMDGATAPAGVRLTPVIQGLEAGSYTATVEVRSSDPDLPAASIPVTLVLTQGPAPPSIRLNVTRRAFAAQVGGQPPDAQLVQISNGGEGVLEGLALTVVGSGAPPDGWLTATLDTTAAPATVTLQPDIRGLAVGRYTSTLRVSGEGADNSPQSVAVTLNVLEAPPPPAIRLSLDSVSFEAMEGQDPDPRSVEVENGGAGELERLSVDVVGYGQGVTGWLTAEISGTAAPATVTLQATTEGLEAGTYTAQVEVASPQADNNPQTIPVTLTVTPGPAIGLSTDSVGFTTEEGSDPGEQTVAITNAGEGTLDGMAATVGGYTGGATGWLEATLGAATAPSTLTLGAAAGALPPGDYSATVELTSAAAVNTPQAVTVTLTVTLAPPDTFTVALSASPTEGGGVSGGGSFEDGSSVTVEATANSGYTFTRWTEGGTEVSTSPGYTFTLTGDRTLVAVFTPDPDPVPAIGLSTDSVGFTTEEGEDPPAQTVTVTNAGGGSLGGLRVSVSGYTGGSGGWLDASLSSGSAPSTLTLETDDADDLDPGVYTATVEIASPQAPNSPQRLTVTLTVTAEASGVAPVMGGESPYGAGGVD